MTYYSITYNKMLICLVIGIVIGFIGCYLIIQVDRQTDVIIAADYVESIVFGDVSGQHKFINMILSENQMTIEQVKGLYKGYGTVSRSVLETQIGVICNQQNISS